MALTTRGYTLADLPTLPDDQLFDIRGGTLVVFSAPDRNHAEVVGELWDLLRAAQRAGFGRTYTAPRAVAFDYAERGNAAQDVTHPDVFFIRRERLSINRSRVVEAAPDLVIEVLSPTTRQDDLPDGDKWAIYERHRVPYYWAVDPEAFSVIQYAWQEGALREVARLRQGDSLSCSLFPGISMEVAQVFANVR